MTAETVELTREMFHCPSWCTVPLETHQEQLDGFEGGASHYSGEWGHRWNPVAGACTEADGSMQRDGLPGVWSYVQDEAISPAEARTMAARLMAAADLAETP
jgi:hypothetical protein